jgi:predicted nucleic acid-binding protein
VDLMIASIAAANRIALYTTDPADFLSGRSSAPPGGGLQ